MQYDFIFWRDDPSMEIISVLSGSSGDNVIIGLFSVLIYGIESKHIYRNYLALDARCVCVVCLV